jgi:hypothetical protein
LVWRRRLVRRTRSLATPQATRPIGVAGSDGPLHRVHIRGRESGSARLGGPRCAIDARHGPRVARCLPRGERCSARDHCSDHGGCARRLDARLPVAPRRRDPLCTGGTRAGPPEDGGGAWASLPLVARHRVRLEALAVVATGRNRLLKAEDQTTIRQLMGDRDTFREAVDPLDAHLQLRPEMGLWPGTVDRALPVVQSVERDLDAAGATRGQGTARQRLNAVAACPPSREDNGGGMPTDGERSRHGERISTGVVESTVTPVIRTRCCTKPPRAWTPRGAPRRWQVRPRGRNGDGDATVPQW